MVRLLVGCVGISEMRYEGAPSGSLVGGGGRAVAAASWGQGQVQRSPSFYIGFLLVFAFFPVAPSSALLIRTPR